MKQVKYIDKLFNKFSLFIAIGISFLFGVTGSIISVVRFWQYDVYYFDFGLFDKAIWSVSRFSLPIIDHLALGEKIIFADHFSPSIFILAPVFWIFPYSETLLVAQAIIVGISGFVLFLIAKHVLKNNYYAICLLLVYFLFTGLQNAVITDFHEVTVATLFFMLTWFCVIKDKKKLFFLSLLLFLGFKESLFLVGIGISIAIFFLYPKWRKISIAALGLSVLWGVVAIKIIIPYFSGGTYFYSEFSISERIFTSFIDNPIKIHTLFYSFFSFGFLPVINPAFWFLIFQDFVVRFYSANFPTRWGLGLHYSALLACIMAVSSIYSISFLQKKINRKFINILVLLLLLNALFLYRVTLDGPFGLVYNKVFYEHTKYFEYLNEVMSLIPKEASVMTQNNLAPHFTHQKVWHLISDKDRFAKEYYTSKMPDYILIDNRLGQSPNNYFGIRDMEVLLSNLKKDKNYKIIYSKNRLVLFKKK